VEIFTDKEFNPKLRFVFSSVLIFEQDVEEQEGIEGLHLL
jgi:hypothetical protein